MKLTRRQICLKHKARTHSRPLRHLLQMKRERSVAWIERGVSRSDNVGGSPLALADVAL